MEFSKCHTNVQFSQERTKEEQKTCIRSLSNPAKLTYKQLKLKLPKKVTWTEDTIDNEHMNKKKSKSIISIVYLF